MPESRRNMIDEALGRLGASSAKGMEPVLEKDARVRKSVADLYVALNELGKTDVAVNMLAEHVAIMVDMINDFKSRR